jgi:hypothetical protein
MSDTSKVPETVPRQVPRTPDQIERDIEATRERLAVTVDELATRVKPKNLARQAGEAARAQVIDPSGAVRTDRVAVIAALVMLFAALSLLRRRRRSD